jgi:hypothetical protein
MGVIIGLMQLLRHLGSGRAVVVKIVNNSI